MMKKISSQKIAQVQDLVRDKDFSKALRLLESIDTTALDLENLAYYYLLFSHINIWLGNYNIREQLNNCIQFYRKSSDNNKYALAKCLYGRYLQSQGNYVEARESFMESYLNYKRLDNIDEEKKVLNYLAHVQFITGAIDDAILNLNRCVEICRSLGKTESATIILRNIGLIHYKTGSLLESLNIYEKIQSNDCFQSDNDKCQFYLTYSLATALAGDIKKARQLIEKSTPYLDDYKREKAIYYEYLGWIYNLNGEFGGAEKILKIGVKFSMQIAPESDLISQTKRLLADAYVGLGKYDLAQKTAEEANVVAEKINERVEIAACYRIFAQIACKKGEKDKARDNYRKACEIFTMIKSRYELAATRCLMADSDLYGRGEKSALLYMAREYFESEFLGQWIEKVDTLLKKFSHSAGAPPPAAESTEKRNKALFVAADPKTKKIVEMAEHIAQSDMTVLLTGQTGTGKDQLAAYIHACSGREGEFVVVNCAAIPDSMVESEMFGFVKGAFTGADHDRTGLFETADKGTIYLNEIADSSLDFQAKLLEVIESRTIRRLGQSKVKPVNFRIIAASNHDLQERMQQRKLRPDLYHRLNEIPMSLPPLCDRPGDIPALTRFFLKQFGFDFKNNGSSVDIDRLVNLLAKQDWIGNVRELRADIKRLQILYRNDISKIIELFDSFKLPARDVLYKTLEETGWNRSETARRLNVSEATIRNWIKKFGLADE